MVRYTHADKILQRMPGLVACSNSPDKRAVRSLSRMKQFSWWKPPHAERDLARRLHCMALYQPLRGFYCDLHINEHLSVCSREHFGKVPFQKLILDVKRSAVWAALVMHARRRTYVVWVYLTHLMTANSLDPRPDWWVVAGKVEGDSRRWLATHKPAHASFVSMRASVCGLLSATPDRLSICLR